MTLTLAKAYITDNEVPKNTESMNDNKSKT